MGSVFKLGEISPRDGSRIESLQGLNSYPQFMLPIYPVENNDRQRLSSN